MKIGIIGNGGFGKEVYCSLPDIKKKNTIFFVDDEYYDGLQPNVLPISEMDVSLYKIIIAIADPSHRNRIVRSLPKNTQYYTYIDKNAHIMDSSVQIGEGSIICAGVILTRNIKIGKHSHLNLLSTIGHDTIVGDYFTTAPGAKISGNCKIGNRVYFGTNSSAREKLEICDDVIIGLNSGVVKSIYESGTYVGLPVNKI